MSKGLANRIRQDFLRVWGELARRPSRNEYYARGRFDAKAIEDAFGGWVPFTQAVGRVSPEQPLEEPRTPKILVVDLEVLPMQVYTYGLFEQNHAPHQIVEHASLASFAAQWIGEKGVIYEEVDWRRNPRDDRALTQKLFKLMREADVICGQNSASFDTKVANERIMFHRLGVMPPVRQIDTKRLGKKHFYFPSYGLEYMAGRYCEAKKMVLRKFPGMHLQIECLRKNPAAWAEMREYNIADVVATVELYKRFSPWGTGVDLNPLYGDAIYRCHCGSTDLKREGFKLTKTGKYQQYSCKSCGSWMSASGAKNNLFSDKKKLSLKTPRGGA